MVIEHFLDNNVNPTYAPILLKEKLSRSLLSLWRKYRIMLHNRKKTELLYGERFVGNTENGPYSYAFPRCFLKDEVNEMAKYEAFSAELEVYEMSRSLENFNAQTF